MLLVVLLAIYQSNLGTSTRSSAYPTVEAVNNQDCDGLFSGDSDFVWEFVATDNTLGRSNNNPSALGGLLGDFNHAFDNNNNGPYVLSSPGGEFQPQ